MTPHILDSPEKVWGAIKSKTNNSEKITETTSEKCR